ncbi:3'(2'),5'-bisphosphate nucleotidase CysQ [Sphingomonas oligophenolica]|uniref:3'(2'),5'-bisphosphate nucleotidase CysQ n=2 Tax=Sphingomonas oligophenolica TaxID=301154 RepID=A0ABU9Y195_9SPHN
MDDENLAALIADTAGRVLQVLAASELWAGAAKGGAADRLSNQVILEALRTHRPEDAILSEESSDDPMRLGRRRVWIIDPLDGTREYCDGRDDWAVQVGLAVGGVAEIGAVAVPARNALWRSDRPPTLPPSSGRLRLLVSRSHPPAGIGRIAAALNADIVPMGSVGVKVSALLEGVGQVYVHYGSLFQWDSCAPVALARAAGLDTSRLSGEALAYNGPGTALPDLVISHPAVTAEVRAVLDRLLPLETTDGPGVARLSCSPPDING